MTKYKVIVVNLKTNAELLLQTYEDEAKALELERRLISAVRYATDENYDSTIGVKIEIDNE